LLFADLEFLLGVLAIGEVARDLGIADDVARWGPDSINDDCRPEPGAVLTDSPTLGLEFALSPGGRQCPRRKPGLLVLLGIKPREVLADNFVRKVSLETLRTGVPTGNYAVGVQHVDGEVGYGLDQ
jgi:hypothetical protein